MSQNSFYHKALTFLVEISTFHVENVEVKVKLIQNGVGRDKCSNS